MRYPYTAIFGNSDGVKDANDTYVAQVWVDETTLPSDRAAEAARIGLRKTADDNDWSGTSLYVLAGEFPLLAVFEGHPELEDVGDYWYCDKTQGVEE